MVSASSRGMSAAPAGADYFVWGEPGALPPANFRCRAATGHTLAIPAFLPNSHLPSAISQFDFDAANFPAHTRRMAKKSEAKGRAGTPLPADLGSGSATGAQGTARPTKLKSSALLDTRVVYCGDNLEQLAKLPDACVDLIYIDPPFNSNRNNDAGQSGSDFWGETKEKRAFEDRHENTKAYIDYMRPRCVQLARVLKKTGSFYYHCDWHASHYVNKVQGGDMGLDADSMNCYTCFQ